MPDNHARIYDFPPGADLQLGEVVQFPGVTETDVTAQDVSTEQPWVTREDFYTLGEQKGLPKATVGGFWVRLAEHYNADVHGAHSDLTAWYQRNYPAGPSGLVFATETGTALAPNTDGTLWKGPEMSLLTHLDIRTLHQFVTRVRRALGDGPSASRSPNLKREAGPKTGPGMFEFWGELSAHILGAKPTE